MGLFSEKEYVCEKCGKTFQKRINLNGNVCDNCWKQENAEKKALEKSIGGYCEYAKMVFHKSYSTDEMKEIIAHRDRILDKYKQDSGISRKELLSASVNYKYMTDDEVNDVLSRTSKLSVCSTMGSAYSKYFYMPTQYEGVIVDSEDIFAVGYTTGYKVNVGTNEAILCAVFTNDPYIPVFTMVFIGVVSIFDFVKSKKGRIAVNSWFEYACPNLTYQVGDFKQLKKQIKQNGDIKGNIDKEFIMDQMYNASSGKGIFAAKNLNDALNAVSKNMLSKMGYILEDDIVAILNTGKRADRKFWGKKLQELSKIN